ncbi:MAG TPA: hypothetical protein VJC17_01465 [Candidatus Dojkabacteria bacterium]|nr:hypothetical protein [Candidatus Dojkabacteria bacterium]
MALTTGESPTVFPKELGPNTVSFLTALADHCEKKGMSIAETTTRTSPPDEGINVLVDTVRVKYKVLPTLEELVPIGDLVKAHHGKIIELAILDSSLIIFLHPATESLPARS